MLLPPIDHIPDGLSKLVKQYRGKPKLAIYIAIFLEQVQVLEDAIHETVRVWEIDNATGARLDVLGARVGQMRVGGSDDVYRVFIKARIRANRSHGTPRDLQAIATATLGRGNYEYYETSGDCYFQLRAPITREIADAAQELLELAAPQATHTWVLFPDQDTPAPAFVRAASWDTGGADYADIPGGYASLSDPLYIPGQYYRLAK